MEWVKLAASYYLDPRICALPDAETEVMFLRSVAYCGAAETGGFIPSSMIDHLGRRNQKRSAQALVDAGLWVAMPTGYSLRQWGKWQVDMEAQRAEWRKRKAQERQRKAAGQ